MHAEHAPRLKARQRLGKYRLVRKIGTGGFADVWKASDQVEGTAVALKIPHPQWIGPGALENFRAEVRLTAGLDHPSILPLKNAEFIDGRLVVAYPLGVETLAERLQRRMVLRTALDYGRQLLDALAYAHEHRIIHCDVKPENLILFPHGRLRLTDFGISKVAAGTMAASGSGTVGYVAPEQAMGRPSFRSDVFSAGLVIWRMLSGELPEWPYAWPLQGHDRLRGRVHPDAIALLRRSLEVDHRKRFADACAMQGAYRKVLPKARRMLTSRSKARRGRKIRKRSAPDWNRLRQREFLRRFRGTLAMDGRCGSCDGPIAEAMQVCPWCGSDTLEFSGRGFPSSCPRCERGRKQDWRFCAWCYGAGFEEVSTRSYSDVRYEGRCAHRDCGGPLMPHMRYCPWCRRKVRRPSKIPGMPARCPKCRSGVADGYWSFCPWCSRRLAGNTA